MKKYLIILAILLIVINIGYYWYYPSSNISSLPSVVISPGEVIDGYSIEKGIVKWKGQILEDADAQTFTVFKGSCCFWAKDKKHVYYGYSPGKPLPMVRMLKDADPSSFVMLNGNYFKDNSHVWDWAGYSVGNTDPMSFEALSGPYAKDKDHAFWNSSVIATADSKTFVSSWGDFDFAMDKDHIFRGRDIIAGAEPSPSTFVTLDSLSRRYAKDGNHVYFEDHIIGRADPRTFTLLNDRYAKDGKNVYSYGVIVNGVKPEDCTKDPVSICSGKI